MSNEYLDICLSSNRHYAVEISQKKVCNFDNTGHVLIFEDDDNNKKAILRKVKPNSHFQKCI